MDKGAEVENEAEILCKLGRRAYREMFRLRVALVDH